MIYIIISSISILSMLVFMGWFVNDALKFIEQQEQQSVNEVQDQIDL